MEHSICVIIRRTSRSNELTVNAKICCKGEEHTKHIVAACTTRAPSEYTK